MSTPSSAALNQDVYRARATLGDGVTPGEGSQIDSGAVVESGVRVGRHVRIGANAVILGSGLAAGAQTQAPVTVLHDEVEVGAGAVIHAGVTLAAGCRVRPGAVVSRSVPPAAIVEGNPANIIGYVGAPNRQVSVVNSGSAPKRGPSVEAIGPAGVTFHTFPVISDLRGDLTVGEFQKQIPFTPLRYFMVFGVPSREIRGEHAHRECHQFLICVKGSCAAMADDGRQRVEVLLDGPEKGLYLPPGTWGVQYKYSADAVLLVFASHHYDAADYLRDYDEFLAFIRAKGA